MKTIVPLAVVASFSLMSCREEPPANPPPPPMAEGGTCNASRAQMMVGKPMLAGSLEAAKRRTGARVARVLRPGQIVTMEYRADRVNLDIDTSQTITGIRCG